MTKTQKYISVCIILILFSSSIAFFVPMRPALVFYFEDTNEIEAFLPVSSGNTFQIIFTHSIHLSDVVEKYKVTSDLNIEQTDIIFEEFGIGMPANAEGNATFEYKDGKYHISGLNQIFESMNIRNGKTVSKHRLVWGSGQTSEEQIVWFNDYFEPGAWYTVKIDKLSLWQYLRGVNIHERSQRVQGN